MKAKEIVEELTAEAELDKTYLGKVVRVTGFGAFVEVLPSVEGLLHVSGVMAIVLAAYEIVCSELCGLGHYKMRSFLHVVSQDEYDAWIAEQASYVY